MRKNGILGRLATLPAVALGMIPQAAGVARNIATTLPLAPRGPIFSPAAAPRKPAPAGI